MQSNSESVLMPLSSSFHRIIHCQSLSTKIFSRSDHAVATPPTSSMAIATVQAIIPRTLTKPLAVTPTTSPLAIATVQAHVPGTLAKPLAVTYNETRLTKARWNGDDQSEEGNREINDDADPFDCPLNAPLPPCKRQKTKCYKGTRGEEGPPSAPTPHVLSERVAERQTLSSFSVRISFMNQQLQYPLQVLLQMLPSWSPGRVTQPSRRRGYGFN
ncbi:hypothetical protein DFH29DRAFT_1049372 [Suillus ampliporus]|nr:hypothetical protein DFH29DRAFT_1049372 [Suillus ampliporus]